MKYNHNQIKTRTNEIVVGNDYAYFEEFPNAIAMVKVLEDNSDAEHIRFKLEVTRAIHPSMTEGKVFECSAAVGLYSYDGMWIIKDPSIINLMGAMGKPSLKQQPMEMDYIKATCKIGQGAECCRYLVMGSKGFECALLEESLRNTIDQKADSGNMISISKNCKGYGQS